MGETLAQNGRQIIWGMKADNEFVKLMRFTLCVSLQNECIDKCIKAGER